jgi:hypothetical protein
MSKRKQKINAPMYPIETTMEVEELVSERGDHLFYIKPVKELGMLSIHVLQAQYDAGEITPVFQFRGEGREMVLCVGFTMEKVELKP